MHVQQALDTIWQKGLNGAYEKAIKDKEECTQKLTKATEALLNYKGEDKNAPKARAGQKDTVACTHVSKAVELIISQVFQLYSNLLMEEAWRPWNKILGKQIDCAPWIDLFGVEHAEKHKRLWSSFMDCITFHLQMVFQSDTVETK